MNAALDTLFLQSTLEREVCWREFHPMEEPSAFPLQYISYEFRPNESRFNAASVLIECTISKVVNFDQILSIDTVSQN